MDAEDGNRESPDAGKSEAWYARLRAASTGPLRDPATDEHQQAARAAQDLRRWLDRIGWPREDRPRGGIGPAADGVIQWGPWAVRAAWAQQVRAVLAALASDGSDRSTASDGSDRSTAS